MTIETKGWRGFAIAALLAFGIATTIATGGGGSGGGGSPISGPTLPLNAANAPSAASAVIIAIDTTFDIGDITGIGIPIQAGDMSLSMSSIKSADAIPAMTVALAAPIVEECINGGTADITYTLADPNTVTDGDRIVAVFDNCDLGDGDVIDGNIDLTVSAIEGDIFSDIFLLAFEVVMTGIEIDDGSEVVTADGDFTLTFDNLEFPVLRLNVAGNELASGSNGEMLTLTNFDNDLSVDFGIVPEAIAALVSGTLEIQGLGGSIDYTTPVVIEAADDLDPHSGEILLTGADDSSVRIVIVDTAHITLEVDENGDGVIDEYIYTNWAELNGRTSTINSSTAPVLAREVYNGVTGFGAITTTAGSQFASTAPFDQVDQLGITGDFTSLDIACVVSGNATVSGSKAVADGYTAGDNLAATFTACARGAEELNGNMDITVTTFGRGEGAAFYVTGSVTETDLVRTQGGSCFTGTGSFETSYDSFFTSAGIVHVETSATAFDVSAGGRTQHLADAANSADVMAGPPPVSVARTSTGTLASDDVAGSFYYATPVPVVFDLDDDPATGPYAGELLVVADDGSTMRMVALDALNVRLDLDLNGDSMIDEELATTWATLAYDDWICP
jgi:hypothetical protein